MLFWMYKLLYISDNKAPSIQNLLLLSITNGTSSIPLKRLNIGILVYQLKHAIMEKVSLRILSSRSQLTSSTTVFPSCLRARISDCKAPCCLLRAWISCSRSLVSTSKACTAGCWARLSVSIASISAFNCSTDHYSTYNFTKWKEEGRRALSSALHACTSPQNHICGWHLHCCLPYWMPLAKVAPSFLCTANDLYRYK